MKRLLAIVFAALCASAHAQTGITVMADTNRVIRTNFSLLRSQVSDLSGASFAISNITGLQTALDGKLATNGSAAGLTSFPSSLLVTNGNAAGLSNITAANITGTVALASNVTQTIAISNGGTGATTVSNARINLLPSYTGNSNRVLALNSNATDLIWTTNAAGGGIVNLADTTNGVTNTLGTANGGTGSTNVAGTNNTSVINANNGVRLGGGAVTNIYGGAAIGNGARVTSGGASQGGAAIGRNASSTWGAAVGDSAAASAGGAVGSLAVTTDGGAVGSGANSGAGGAVGNSAVVTNYNTSTGGSGGAVGSGALAWDGFSGGRNAKTGLSASNSVQLGTGTNSNNLTIQFLTAGSVDTNEWAALANSTTFGHYIMAAPTNGTANQILALNSNATAVVWTTNAGGSASTVDLSTTNATGVLPISKGGTGGTNRTLAFSNLGIFTGGEFTRFAPENSPTASTIDLSRRLDGAGSDSNTIASVSIGAYSYVAADYSIAIGADSYVAKSSTNEAFNIAIGFSADTGDGSGSIAIGKSSFADNTNAVQIGTGDNYFAHTIQFLSAGSVSTNEWSYLANVSSRGAYAMTNTAGISTNITFVDNNTNTNSVTISNGIITGWTQ